jgi:hypothetical protein
MKTKLTLLLAILLIGSNIFSQSEYTKTLKVHTRGGYNYHTFKYEPLEEINNTEITFLKLTETVSGAEYCRVTFDMGYGKTTHDYMIMNTIPVNLNNQVFFTTYELLSPFGEKLLLKFNNKMAHLFYKQKNNKFELYYTGDIR